MKNLAVKSKSSRINERSPKKFSTVQLKRRPMHSNFPSRRRFPKMNTSMRTSLQIAMKNFSSFKTSLVINFALFPSVEFELIAFDETELFPHSVTGLKISK